MEKKKKRGRPKGSKNKPKQTPIKKSEIKKKGYKTENEIENALWETGGFISQAARRLGISQPAVSMRIKKSKRLQIAMFEIQNQYLDFTESKLLKKIKQEDLGAICFYLKCKGKERGYVEHQKHVVSHEGEINQTGTIEHEHNHTIAIDTSPDRIAGVLDILINTGFVKGKLVENIEKQPGIIDVTNSEAD